MSKDTQLQQAQEQRYAALKNAFSTIEAFAIPSLSPDEMEQLDNVRKVLEERYACEEVK